MSLLTENYQKIIKREKILRVSAMLLFLFSLAVLVGLVFILPSYFMLSLSKDSVLSRLRVQEEVLARKKIGQLEEEIKKVNKLVEDYEKNEQRRKSFSGLIARLFKLTPESEIKILDLALKQDKSGVFLLEIKGNASTRESFLRYISTLEVSADFSDVLSPITNLLSDSNVGFSIVLKIKPEIYAFKP